MIWIIDVPVLSCASLSQNSKVNIKTDQQTNSLPASEPAMKLLTHSNYTFVLFAASSFVIAHNGLDVSFPTHDGLVLEGTLHLPSASFTTTKDRSESLSPNGVGVVLVHGSGPVSRHSKTSAQLNLWFGFTIPVFDEIAAALVDAGMAVLTYDKRTCGTFNECSNNNYPTPDSSDNNNLTAFDFIQDAQSAVEFLEMEWNIPNVVVVGHSQSGQFIPILLEQHSTLRGGVILAGSFRPFDEMLRYQLEFTLDFYEKFGVNETEAMKEPNMVAFVEWAEAVEAIRNGTSNSPIGGLSADFYRSLFDIREQALLAASSTDLPMLILNGEQDWNNPPSEAVAWADYLAAAGSTNFEIEILPCITHAMNCLTEPDPTKLDRTKDLSKRVEPVVTQALTDFIFKSTGKQTDNGEQLSSAWALGRTSKWMIFLLAWLLTGTLQ